MEAIESELNEIRAQLARTSLRLHLLEQAQKLTTKTQRNIMSAISDYTDAVNAQFSRVNAGVANISSDILGLKKIIEDINNSPGEISPEDQARLDESLAVLKGIADQVEALAASTEDAPPAPE